MKIGPPSRKISTFQWPICATQPTNRNRVLVTNLAQEASPASTMPYGPKPMRVIIRVRAIDVMIKTEINRTIARLILPAESLIKVG